MITLDTWFWIMVGLFGIIGMMRGWTKEIVVTAALVLSLFALLTFGHYLINPLAADAVTPQDRVKMQFYVASAIHLVFAFFAYQGPAFMRQVSRGRFGERARGAIQESLLGFVVGAVNGYLIVGTLWSFLEYNFVAKLPVDAGVAYPFATLIRPEVGSRTWEMISKMPLPLLEGWLPFLVVVLFLFVIIAMI